MKWLATMVLTCCASAGLCVLAPTSVALAQEAEADNEAPSTQPADAAADQSGGGNSENAGEAQDESLRDGMMRSYGRPWMGRGWGAGPGALGEITEEEWIAAAEFMREHSPNRWRLFERISDGAEAGGRGRGRGPVIRMIIARYRNLQNVKEEDPDLYELRVQQLKVDDEIWHTVREMRRSTNDEQREQLGSTLREKVSTSINIWMKEREHRLGRLEQTLKRERQRLEGDRARHETMVENRVQRELERIPDFMAFPRPPETPAAQ